MVRQSGESESKKTEAGSCKLHLWLARETRKRFQMIKAWLSKLRR
jgi:hypothetical protein